MLPDESTKPLRNCGTSDAMPYTMTGTMLRHASAIAAEHRAQALLICGADLSERDLLSLSTGIRTIVLLAGDAGLSTGNETQTVIRVPYPPPTRMSQIRMAVLLALSHGLLQPNDTVVCVSGSTDVGVLDSIVAMRVGEEFAMFLGPNRAQWESTDVRPDVLQRVIELATELSIEGREGNSVGALFVVGDIPSVISRTHQMVLNPFLGYGPEQRNILNPGQLGETVKEFSTIDGAFLVSGDGAIVAAGAHIDSALLAGTHLPSGLGARHRAAAAITQVTNSIAITLSQSTGNVTIFRRGRVAAEFPRPTDLPRDRALGLAPSSEAGGRILIIGGGIAGMSIARSLTDIGLPVTILEAGEIGSGTTTRNQGWLWSGGLIAREQPELARLFHESLQETLAFSPGCVEPQTGRMLYLFTNPRTPIDEWTDGWRAVGIPFEPVALDEIARELPQIRLRSLRAGFRLPDRSIRSNVLLNQLAVTARQAGAEIRTGTPVVELMLEEGRASGVLTSQGEMIPAAAVIVATGSTEHRLLTSLSHTQVPTRDKSRFITLKSHLLAIRPGIGSTPFCVADQGGFNHLPHTGLSLFGSNRWISSRGPSEAVIPEEIDRLWTMIETLFPSIRRTDAVALEWAGTTVQQRRNRAEPAFEILGPTVIEHPPLQNVLSALAGRASLWCPLAEQVRQAVVARINTVPVAAPPWAEFALR